MPQPTLCILGGSGFVGSHLLAHYTRVGASLRVPTRRRERHRDLLVMPRVELIQADIHDPATLARLFEGCDAVINLVGILNEGSAASERFASAHLELSRKVLTAMEQAEVPRLLHMSALGADPDEPRGRYLRTKGEAERLVLDNDNVAVTVFRPSVIFGRGDSFFNRFARLLRLTPWVFPLACADSRFAPVYVGDVVQAFAACLEEPDTIGRGYELCGPQSYTLRELVAMTARELGLRRRIVGLPDPLSRLQAQVLQLLPGKPFSMDNYHSLQHDSLCRDNGLRQLGIEPTSIEAQLPTYIGNRNARARYTDFRRHARRG